MLLDVFLMVLLLGMAVALVSGGLLFEVASVRIRITSLTNPTVLASAAIAVRYLLRYDLPFLGIPALRVESAGERLLSVARRHLNGEVIDARTVRRVLAILSVSALAVKLAGAWFLPGFFSGDDVEIHDMSLSVLHGFEWPIWDLRSALFPLGFIYPAQWTADALGIDDPRGLVFAGRFVVALLSTAAIALTWLAARRVVPGYPAVALLAAVFVAFNKLQIAFGSSELPRPVAAVLILAAFTLLLSCRGWPILLAGCLIGFAAAFRFSEAVFAAPAVLTLALRRQWRDAALLLAGASLAAVGAVGMADELYWGDPFSSLRHAIDYTLIAGASSRGHERFFAYLVLVPQWTNWVVFILAFIGARRYPALALWTFLPIVVLSVLPHKETRYLIPSVPYLCISAAIGLRRAFEFAEHAWPAWQGDAIAALLPPLLALGLLQDAGGWRLPRSNDEVRLAEWLRSQGSGGVAIRQPWRAGGAAYLSGNRPLVDMEDPRFETPEGRREMFKDVRWIVVDPLTSRVLMEREARELGFRPVGRWADRYQIYGRS